MSFQQRYNNLNGAQRQAVDTLDGPVMVIAGPGTGKTELLSVRAANILKQTDTLPENILCLTFTESGAAAMRERLVDIIGRDAYKIAVHTFHSFGSEIISHNREHFYKGAQFKPADEIATFEILHGLFSQLDYKNPLASKMNDEFTFLKDTRQVISELKRSGLEAHELQDILETNDQAITAIEALFCPIFVDRMSPKLVPQIAAKLDALKNIHDIQTLADIPRLSEMVAGSLETALGHFNETGKATAVTAWKNQWFKKSDRGIILIARERQERLYAVKELYVDYLAAMEKAGLYDFDDMILQVVQALDSHSDLLFGLQEKYLYIMVDEFQDTNLAQMRILRSLTNNPVNEGRPNILVVGDDDQAIYSFQGALISNILEFSQEYPSVKRIVLTDNYRSTPEILAHARQVISQGDDRLENRIEGLSKLLTAHKPEGAQVSLHQADTAMDERQWLVKAIASDIERGVKPSGIAVLTRHHNTIATLLPFFEQAKIPVQYERRDNILSLEPIIQLEQLSRVVIALAQGHLTLVDSLLPKLIAHPAWKFEAKDVWKLSVNAYEARTRWLDTMVTTPVFAPFAEWLISLAHESLATPLEPMTDRLIGRPDDQTGFKSPFYEYFFSSTALEKNPEQYITFLNGLRGLREKIVEFKAGEELYLPALIELIDTHRRLGTTIRLHAIGGDVTRDAVQLMTVHASKGMEFDTVYVTGAIDGVWGEKAGGNKRKIHYPENIGHLAPVGESADERLRLFYVALTRAKQSLHVSYSLRDDKDKPSLRVSFLADIAQTVEAIPPAASREIVTQALETTWHRHLSTPSATLEELLAGQLSQYKLSATHLNAFIDLMNHGPQSFLLNYLLRFPQAPSPQLAYGNAIHQTLQQAHTHFTIEQAMRPTEDIIGDFTKNLQLQRLSATDYEQYLQRGSDELRVYLAARSGTFSTSQKTELNFSYQNSVVDDAILTGSLDLVDIDPSTKTITVTDYKTGKPSLNWTGKSEFDKVKLHKYRQQLIFYTLLVEQSRDYSAYKVSEASLEFIRASRSGEIVKLVADISPSDIEEMKKLIVAVWTHIKALSFPDVSQYPQTLRGIQAFEQDLINGVV